MISNKKQSIVISLLEKRQTNKETGKLEITRKF